jgi:hypothetical protein
VLSIITPWLLGRRCGVALDDVQRALWPQRLMVAHSIVSSNILPSEWHFVLGCVLKQHDRFSHKCKISRMCSGYLAYNGAFKPMSA